MWALIGITLLQCLLLSTGQVLLKRALLQNEGEFSFMYGTRLFANGWFIGHMAMYVVASVLWWFIVKRYPLSVVYPLASFSYVFGVLAAVFVFHEQVSMLRWIGLALVVIGCCLIAK